MNSRLTDRERKALGRAAEHMLAGGTEDLRDALGVSEEEAEEMFAALERASCKILPPPRAKKANR